MQILKDPKNVNKAKYHNNFLKFNIMSKMLIETIPIPPESQKTSLLNNSEQRKTVRLKQFYKNSLR